jgi:putative tryptophan/tyrosine transport system substrate-binding protein
MRRRDFVTLLGGAAAWPRAVRAQQQPDRMRRIGVLHSLGADDPVAQPEIAAFQQALRELGWEDGRNIKVEYRWAAGDVAKMSALARDLVNSQFDVLVSRATPVTRAVVNETRTIPIVFVQVSDPVGDGFIASFARPGGNATGFTNIESSMIGKWVELLKEIVPRLARAAFLYHPQTTPGPAGGSYFLRPFETVARLFQVEPITVAVHDISELKEAINSLAQIPHGGLIVSPGTFILVHRDLVLRAAAQSRLPSIYPFTFWAHQGGLMSYGTNSPDLFRRAASYVDRILKGANPADLPVQAPTKFELVINLKAANALGLEIPPMLLARADEVIE